MTANATRRTLLAATVFAAVLLSCGQPFSRVQAADGPKAFIDGTGLGWTPSGKDD